jgi:cytochrome bd-type quinol oxidase subunit 2
METSLFLAQLIGPVLIVIGVGLLLKKTEFREMATDFLSSRALIFVSGLLTLVAGLAIVLTHNVWEFNWPVIITILGWLSVFGGVFRILFPNSVQSVGTSMLDKPATMTVSGAIQIVLGLWLSYVGYMG